MQNIKMTIDLDEFLRCVIQKWKTSAIIIVVFAVLFAGIANSLGEEISVPHSEEYLFYEDALARHLKYVDESVLMTMDSTCFYERTLLIRNIEDEEMLKLYAESSEIWEDLETDRNKKYLPELLVWNQIEAAGEVELELRHATSAECGEWAEYIARKLSDYDEQLEVIIGPEKIMADEDIQQEQLRRYTRTEHIKGLLLDSRAGYTIKVNVAAAAATGAITGMVVSLIVMIIQMLIIQNKQIKESEVARRDRGFD